VENSGTAIGIRCVDGCVLGVEKVLHSPLLKPGGNKQIATLGAHQGLVFSGWAPDARQLVERGRDEIHNYEETYGGVVPPEVLAERMAQYVHYFTIHGALRPFGIGAILAGYDPELKNHSLHMIEPNGVQYRYFGCALGKVGLGGFFLRDGWVGWGILVTRGDSAPFASSSPRAPPRHVGPRAIVAAFSHLQGRMGAKTEIEKLDLKALTCREALKHVAKIIHTLHDEGKVRSWSRLWVTGFLGECAPMQLR